MNPDRIQKQTYLRTEILEAGYDGAAFQAYCQKIHPDASDNIDAWTFEQLKNIVEKFKEFEHDSEQNDTRRSQLSKSLLVPENQNEQSKFIYE